jgi:hypothetical protein
MCILCLQAFIRYLQKQHHIWLNSGYAKSSKVEQNSLRCAITAAIGEYGTDMHSCIFDLTQTSLGAARSAQRSGEIFNSLQLGGVLQVL